ncbi:MAG: DDE-type integrase/transposase/recombinase [Alphaproteobacteria bacterium]|nr:DDE-type integrase/transposase/recombinase [Alphaproteobacteria bacterium]
MSRAPSARALLRYQAISAYVSLDPPRGERTATLRTLAERAWTLPDGRVVRFSAETLRGWVRRYRQGGLAALEDAPRPQPGVQVITPEQVDVLCQIKRDVPARSVERVIEVAEALDRVPKGLLSRSTVHRVLQAHGLSKRKPAEGTTTDLDRFEAAFPNDLWQSDMLAGPWLPDPDRPGHQRRAWLHAFLDDHSRLLLAGRFAFKGDLPTLELVFREALRRHGVPRRVYYDNGGPYRSKHMAQVVAVLGCHAPVHTPPYRPEGHGKIEAFNRYCRAAFVEEVRASAITTLDALNRAFRAWGDLKYNRRVHGETQQAPWDRWRAGADRVRPVDERTLVDAFLFRANRTPDKTAIFRLHGVRFQVSPRLARKPVEVRYDPEDLGVVEVWRQGSFVERITPFEVTPHRRPVVVDPPQTTPATTPTSDFLATLVDAHTPAPVDDAIERALAERQAQDDGVVELVRARVASDVFDEALVREFLDQFGPFEPDDLVEPLELALELGGADQHVVVLLTRAVHAGEVLT